MSAIAIWIRYFVESDSKIRTLLEEHVPETNLTLERSNAELLWLPKVVRDFVLPSGFPGQWSYTHMHCYFHLWIVLLWFQFMFSTYVDTVSDDYLDYMLLQFPTNVTGWICHTLVTSSLLKACLSNSLLLFHHHCVLVITQKHCNEGRLSYPLSPTHRITAHILILQYVA